MLKVKICGNHLTEDISLLQKHEQNIDYIGFIFTTVSKRYVPPKRVTEWMGKYPFLRKKAVAVFLDQDIEEVINILRETGIGQVQLHGNESVAYCQDLKREYYCGQLQLWKVVPVEAGKASNFTQFLESVDVILLDTKIKGVSGGTGQPFDWSIISKVKEITSKHHVPLFIAGGITPQNVKELIASYDMDGIDLASGVETDLAKEEEKLWTLLKGVESRAGSKI